MNYSQPMPNFVSPYLQNLTNQPFNPDMTSFPDVRPQSVFTTVPIQNYNMNSQPVFEVLPIQN